MGLDFVTLAQVTPTATLEVRMDGQVVKVGDVRNLPVGVYILLYTATRRDQQIAKSTSVTGAYISLEVMHQLG
jgi:hypothetical protein